jgi:hypothetical protein
MIRLFGAVLLWLHAAVYANESRPGESCAKPVTVIESVRVFDGEKTIPEATVIIRCTLIERVVDDADSLSVASESRLVDGKPDQTITDTRNIVTIWKAGRAHSP